MSYLGKGNKTEDQRVEKKEDTHLLSSNTNTTSALLAGCSYHSLFFRCDVAVATATQWPRSFSSEIMGCPAW